MAILTTEKLVAAYERAVADKLVAYKINDYTFAVPSSNGKNLYSVVVSGPRPVDLRCNCPGGFAPVCKHRATVIAARKHHVFAVKPLDFKAPEINDF